MDEPTKYVCTVDDLDLLLDEDLKRQFQDLFSNSWRLRYVKKPKDQDDWDKDAAQEEAFNGFFE